MPIADSGKIPIGLDDSRKVLIADSSKIPIADSRKIPTTDSSKISIADSNKISTAVKAPIADSSKTFHKCEEFQILVPFLLSGLTYILYSEVKNDFLRRP